MEEILVKLGASIGGFATVGWILWQRSEKISNQIAALAKEVQLMREAIQQANYVEILKLIGLPHMNKRAKEELQNELQKIDENRTPQ